MSAFYRDEKFDALSERWAATIIAKERGSAKQKDVAAAFEAICDYLDARFTAAAPTLPSVQERDYGGELSALVSGLQGIISDLSPCPERAQLIALNPSFEKLALALRGAAQSVQALPDIAHIELLEELLEEYLSTTRSAYCQVEKDDVLVEKVNAAILAAKPTPIVKAKLKGKKP